MSDAGRDGYAFADGIPIQPVEPGSTVLVSGERFSAAADVARSMVVDGTADGEGALFITTNDTCSTVLDTCLGLRPGLDDSRIGIVDCTGQEDDEDRLADRVSYVSSQRDLTGIGMKFSALYEALYGTATDGRVRTGLFSLSSLLVHVDLRTLFRFAQTISGRIDSADGLGVMVLDPTAQDAQKVSTMSQVADGIVDVREHEGDGSAYDGELRVRGLRDHDGDWRPFSLSGPAQSRPP